MVSHMKRMARRLDVALSALIMVSRGKHRAGRLDDGCKGGLG